MRKIVQAICGTASAGVFLMLTLLVYIQMSLPDSFSVIEGEQFIVNSKISITASSNEAGVVKALEPKVYDKEGNTYAVNFHVFDTPVMEVQAGQRKMVVPGGNPFGIKMFCEGVLVVGMSDIQIGTQNLNPAKDAGLKIGDILTHINGVKVEGNDDVAMLISQSNGDDILLSVLRDDSELTLTLAPIHSEMDNTYKAGIWVRDSSAGIGTLTYYDPDTMGFAGLGHAICDIDTGEIMPLSSGEIVDVNISGVHAGQSGKPGELRGTFTGDAPVGFITKNTECGIFGEIDDSVLTIDPIPMAYKQEVQTGPATILATTSGNKPQEFEISIEKVNYSDINPTKNMVIQITDERLLSTTGGIVQGMSGSPIIQDGKLVGAVTHVFVNDPTQGYGIFAENMDKELNHVEYYEKPA